MPIYEYECDSCEQRTEAIQRLDEAPLTICPHCGGKLRKLMSAPSFQFKGTGWYVTDYAGKSKGEGEAKEKGGAGESKSAEGAESKPGDGAKPAKSEASGSSSSS